MNINNIKFIINFFSTYLQLIVCFLCNEQFLSLFIFYIKITFIDSSLILIQYFIDSFFDNKMDAKSVCLKIWLLIFATGVLEIPSIHSKQKAKLNIPRAQSIGQSFRLSFRARVSRQALHLAVIYSNDSPTLVSLHKLPAFPPGL